MTIVRLLPQAGADLVRLVEFLQEHEPVAASETESLIYSALRLLTSHPLIGRPAEDDLRELVISRGRSGYLALYDYNEALDEVMVLAIRHQREAGYAD